MTSDAEAAPTPASEPPPAPTCLVAGPGDVLVINYGPGIDQARGEAIRNHFRERFPNLDHRVSHISAESIVVVRAALRSPP